MEWTAQKVRETFLRFFEERGHTRVQSSPLLPHGDPTLLFTNAGMNQFKAYFLGERVPPFTRATSVQKCIRAGGKHNDLDNVGFTRRHHTFFEMLGNFSFGDYFKREAILWAWELMTEVFRLDPDRLWVSVYLEDDEAYEIWQREVGVPEHRILRLGKKDNFWEMGEVGPCGPSSEIHYDLGPEFDPHQQDPGQEGERFLELWNLVFMEFERKPDGSLSPLPNKNIDTGMGLERLLAVLQGVDSNFHTDLFMPIIEEVERISGVPYSPDERGAPHRVLADHARALTFAISDHIYPSNFGRGYVLRRILRRAHRFGQKIGIHEPILYRLVPVVVHIMKSAYPDLEKSKTEVELIVKREEERFLETLARNLPRLEEAIEEARDTGVLPGEVIFKLYDTYGLPLDLIEEVGREAGVTFDWEGFEAYLERQRARARKAQKEATLPELQEVVPHAQPTEFLGYETLDARARLTKWATQNGRVYLVFDRTPFYARSGGQVGDRGVIQAPGIEIEVLDTVKVGKDHVHIGKLRKGDRVRTDVEYELHVDPKWRRPTMRAHTATHLLHAALREVLGDHVRQEGSLVEPDRTRFDFSHPAPLTEQELQAVEDLVNEKIRENLDVRIQWMDYQRALEMGAMAIFEEKYEARVRVVSCGDFSKELCGGTHVSRTGDIGLFVIVKEEASSAGIRRIDAYTGQRALEYLREKRNRLQEVAEALGAEEAQVLTRIHKLKEEWTETQKAYREILDRYAYLLARQIAGTPLLSEPVWAVVTHVEGIEMAGIQRISDFLVDLSGRPYVILLVGSKNGKVSVFSRVHKDLSHVLSAADLVRQVAKALGGGGGGSPVKAEGGGRHVERIPEALHDVQKTIQAKVQDLTLSSK